LVALRPGHGNGWFNLGNVLAALDRHPEAVAAFERALAVTESQGPVLINLALSELRCGHPAPARNAAGRVPAAFRATPGYRMLLAELAEAEGRDDEALAHCTVLLDQHPDHVPALVGRSRLLRRRGQGTLAAAGLEDALARGEDARLLVELAETAHDLGRHERAASAAGRAAALAPQDAAALNAWGKALALRGELARAAEVFRTILRREPHRHGVHGNLLFALLHDDRSTPEEVFAEARRFGDIWERRFSAPDRRPGPGDTPGRRLRIGYVSPDFCDHAVAMIFAPLLEHHDRQEVEIVCYHVPRQIDEVTARLRRGADHWRTLDGSDFPAMAGIVGADRIDILVDLAGHTNRNVLPLFALRPAPIQVSAIGYPGTTGLTRIDYRLAYGSAPKESDSQAFSTEILVQLFRSLPYRLPEQAPEVVAPPMLETGAITFGSVTKFAKVNQGVRRCWARLLARLPTARLLVIAPSGNRPEVGREIRALFAAEGADPDQILIESEAPLDRWLALFARIDIVLDPFPYAGGTTIPLTHWMGVPVITLRPEQDRDISDGRWIFCRSLEHYLDTAVALATDRDALIRRRAELRARTLLDEHLNHRLATRDLERWYREIWQLWLAGHR